MTARARVAAFVVVILLGLVAVASAKTAVTSTVTLPSATTTPLPYPCNADAWYMQCGGNAPGQELAPLPGLSNFGVDSYGATNPGIGANFDCSYLSGYPGGKDWTSYGIKTWLDPRKSVCFVWETYANRAEYGYVAGRDDAFVAAREMAELGVPTYVGIRFAVDTPASSQAVEQYFAGAKSVIGSRVGAYGSYTVVNGLEEDGITTAAMDWQTVAWSYGQRSRACLYQSSINHEFEGVSVDFDEATCADFGQYPYNYKPLVVCFGKHASGSVTCRHVHNDIRQWELGLKESEQVYKVRGCHQLVETLNTLNNRWNWYWVQLRDHPNVKRAARLKAKAATATALGKIRDAFHGRSCVVFSTRVSYFKGRIATIEKQYGDRT